MRLPPNGLFASVRFALKVFATIDGDVQLAQELYVKSSSADELAANTDNGRQDVECA